MWFTSSFTRAATSLLPSVYERLDTKIIGSVRHFSKYLSRSAAKRIPLTTKRAKKGFYKGKGATTEGRITSTGKFIVDWSRRLELVVPDLTGFKVSASL